MASLELVVRGEAKAGIGQSDGDDEDRQYAIRHADGKLGRRATRDELSRGLGREYDEPQSTGNGASGVHYIKVVNLWARYHVNCTHIRPSDRYVHMPTESTAAIYKQEVNI